MPDFMERMLHVNWSGDTYKSEQRYRLIVAAVTGVAGFIYLPFTAVLWIVTAIKILHWYQQKKPVKRAVVTNEVSEQPKKDK